MHFWFVIITYFYIFSSFYNIMIVGDYMNRKIVLLFIILILCSGCINTKKVEKKKEKKKVEVEYVETYKDLNNTPIAFYRHNGNHLDKLTKINKNLVSMEDIDVFQIYPSNLDTVNLNKGFGESFYDEWIKYNTNNNLKIGFNIKFSTDEEDISYNIFNPSNCMEKWQYLLNYLYDDYANRGKSFYSHIEENEFNENSLTTSIKIQSSGDCYKIKDKIVVTVFTYDTDDDFKDGEYRGNSSSTLTICLSDNC